MLSIVVEEEDRSGLELDMDRLVREGARRMLVAALKVEVDAYVAAHAGERDGEGRALVVRNGVAQPRKVTTAAGELQVQAPRVNERRAGCRFTSAILPPWARRSPKVTRCCPCSLSAGHLDQGLRGGAGRVLRQRGRTECFDHPAVDQGCGVRNWRRPIGAT